MRGRRLRPYGRLLLHAHRLLFGVLYETSFVQSSWPHQIHVDTAWIRQGCPLLESMPHLTDAPKQWCEYVRSYSKHYIKCVGNTIVKFAGMHLLACAEFNTVAKDDFDNLVTCELCSKFTMNVPLILP